MKPLWSAVLLGPALVLAGPGRADPKADALVKKARQVLVKAKSLEADVVLTQSAGTAKQSMKGSVRLMKPNLVEIRLAGGSGERVLVSDGTNAFVVSPADKIYQKMEADPRPGNLFGLGGSFSPLGAFFTPERMATGGTLRAAAPEKVEGKTYQVVELTSKQSPQNQKFYFGPTGILEGAQVKFGGEGGGQTVSMWLKNVRLDTPLKAETFAYKPPEGFEQQRGPEDSLLAVGKDAPDFLLPQPGGGDLGLSDARKGKKAVLVNFWFYG